MRIAIEGGVWMRKFTIIVMALAASLVALAGTASATGGGKYPYKFPTVAPSAASVPSTAPFTVTATNFCTPQPISITLINLSNSYTQTVNASGVNGTGTVTFNNPPTSPAVAPGIYLIVASSGPPCNKLAISYVQVTGPVTSPCTPHRTDTYSADDHHCSSGYLHTDSFGAGAPGDVQSLVESLAIGASDDAVHTAVMNGELSGASSSVAGGTLPVTGSNTVSTVQLALVAVLGGLAMVLVAGRRRHLARTSHSLPRS
jgi:hypothetical protein